MTDQFAELRAALSLFDTAAQAHGWASDMGTQSQAKTAFVNYQQARAAIQAAIDAQAAEIEQLREALKTISDWQAPNVLARGELVSMRVALGSNGERDWFRGVASAALSGESK